LLLFSPRPENPTNRLALKDLWKELPEPVRHRVLGVLSRMVAHHLLLPPKRQEVDHDTE
jgi:hypothetical protein